MRVEKIRRVGLNGSGFPAKASPRNFPKRNYSNPFFCPVPLVLSSLRPGLGAGKSGEPSPPSADFSERKEGGIPGGCPEMPLNFFLSFL